MSPNIPIFYHYFCPYYALTLIASHYPDTAAKGKASAWSIDSSALLHGTYGGLQEGSNQYPLSQFNSGRCGLSGRDFLRTSDGRSETRIWRIQGLLRWHLQRGKLMSLLFFFCLLVWLADIEETTCVVTIGRGSDW